MNGEFKIFSGSSNPDLAKKICRKMGTKLGRLTTARFPDGEIHVKFEDNIRGKDIFLIQSTCTPVNDSIMELLLMIDAAKRSSAKQIVVVIPYFGYARQDRKETSRVPISARLVADMLTIAGATRVISVDLHSPQIQGFFNIPMDNLYCYGVISQYLANKFDKETTAVVAPDGGSMKNVVKYSDILGMRFSAVHKSRTSGEATEAMFVTDVDAVVDKDCILIDDLTATCGTLINAANILKEKGAKDVYACVSHCCLNDKGYENLKNSCIKQLITTDTIPSNKNKKVKILSVADLLNAAILRTHDGRSIEALFDIEVDDE